MEIWNYEAMKSRAEDLIRLESETKKNKENIISAINNLGATNSTVAIDNYRAELEDKIWCMDTFASILHHESDTIQLCVDNMQKADQEIADEIRRIFRV